MPELLKDSRSSFYIGGYWDKGQGPVESCIEDNLDFELRALQTECRELTRVCFLRSPRG